MRLVHTSDWHIGKTFGFADEAAQALREERLDAITRIGLLARSQAARTVLVAGDIYDVQTPSDRTLRQPVERMRAFPDVAWHLIPGNHDPHTPRGPWERLRTLPGGLPGNVHLHLSQEPADLGGAWLLPAVLDRRHAASDPTAWMDEAPTPEGAIRIGLAHGSVTEFGSEPGSTTNVLALDRPERAGLAYLGLGDFHGAQRITNRVWYSGTHEMDDFGTGGSGGGEVLLVDIEGPLAPPRVTQHRIGRFLWHRMEHRLHHSTDIDILETRLRALSDDLGTVLVWLHVEGTLTLVEMEGFENRIRGGVRSALRALRLDDRMLLPRPSPADLEDIDHAGFVRRAADRLAARAQDDADPQQDLAAAALLRLYLLDRASTGVRS